MSASVFIDPAARKSSLAAFIAEQVLTALAEPGAVLNAAVVERAITAFECGAAAGVEPCRVAVVLSGEEHALDQAITMQRTLRLEVKSTGFFRVAFDRDPSLAVTLIARENQALKLKSSKDDMIIDMHRELVGMLAKIVPALEHSGAGVTLIESAKSLLSRAQTAQGQPGGIASTVSPLRLLNAIENVLHSYQDILSRYGAVLDRESLVLGMRVVSDAMVVLEEIHGPDEGFQLDEDEGEGGDRPGG